MTYYPPIDVYIFFFFNDTATTEIYTLSLHDALPISHLGYVMLGLASLDLIGIQGAVIQMVSHGLVAAGLFLMVGMIYERCHTRDLAAYGGLARLLPVYSVFFMILTLASVGLPTTSGFTGEFL